MRSRSETSAIATHGAGRGRDCSRETAACLTWGQRIRRARPGVRVAFGMLGKNLGPMGALGSLLDRSKTKPGGKPSPALGAGASLLSRQDQRARDPLAM